VSKREVDPKRTRKARRLIEKLAAQAATRDVVNPETGEIIENKGVDYSGWEKEFLGEVDQRLEKYGSAFHDLSKGSPDEALSRLQSVKLKEIAKKARDKARGKEPKGFKPKKGLATRKPLRAKRKPR
jgi:hypothetical protein